MLIETPVKLTVSKMADTLIGSEIIRLAGEINAKIKNGEKIYNLTIGDFDPKIFPIPTELKTEIIAAYNNDETNYPPADGIAELRQSVSQFLKQRLNLDYSASQILIAGGARPLIYGTFRTLIDDNDTIVFPVPSWNNNHYCHLTNAKQIIVETKAENNFMPTAAELQPHLRNAQMVTLCSPLNPTGTTFTKQHLQEICELILEENYRRNATDEKPLYLMYDQIYWMLTAGETQHYNPVTLFSEMKNYTIFIDGLSKGFAATGVRVGWAMGPQKIIDKMKSIVGHMGAWSPKAEQVATAKYLKQEQNIEIYLNKFKHEIELRLEGFYKGFKQLKSEGFNVDAIAPQAAIYLGVQLNLHGQIMENGVRLNTTKEVTKYILDEAKIGLVPFAAFGASENSSWYRLSVGTASLQDIDGVINSLRNALGKLK